MYKFRFKNLYDMHDNIKGALDIVSGPETIDPAITTADGRGFSLLAIVKRVQFGHWELLREASGLPLRSGDITVPAGGENAIVVLLYAPNGVGNFNGINVTTLAVPENLTFGDSGDDDLEIMLESQDLPIVIAEVTPAGIWDNAFHVNTFSPAVQTAAHRTINLKSDEVMGGTLTSVISLTTGNTVPPRDHIIHFDYKENNIYLVCYDVPVPQPADPNTALKTAIYAWVSAGAKVGAGGIGVIGNRVFKIPDNTPMGGALMPYSRDITKQWNSLYTTFQNLNLFCQKHAKEISAILAGHVSPFDKNIYPTDFADKALTKQNSL